MSDCGVCQRGHFAHEKKEGGGGNWGKKRAIIYVRNALTMTGLIFSKGSFKNYVDKMRWVGGQKVLLFVHV